jgi:hypothetical protein
MTEYERIRAVIVLVDSLIANRYWTVLNQALRDLDAANEDGVIVIAWLRSSFCVREKLPDYAATVERARLTMGDHALQGLTPMLHDDEASPADVRASE